MGEWDAPIKPVKPKPRRWLRILGIGGGSLPVLLVAAYFVATSSWFLRKAILPKVGAALNATVTVEEASIGLFSPIVLRGLEIRAPGTEPALRAEEVAVRLDLWATLRGQPHIVEVTIEAPVVQLIENADGSNNLTPILKSLQSEPTAELAEPGDTEPPRLELRKASLRNATFRHTRPLPTGATQIAEIARFNATVADVGNDRTGSLGLEADLTFGQTPITAANAGLTAKLQGQFAVTLDPNLQPAALKGGLQITVTEARGPLTNAADLKLAIEADATMNEIRALSVRLLKGATPLGTVAASGPFDLAKLEGRVNLNLHGVDRHLLNLAGARFAADFNATAISSSNIVEVTRRAASLAVQGQVAVATLSLTVNGQSTPTLDLAAAYDLAVDQPSRRARLRTFTIQATQTQDPLIVGALTRPLDLDWSGAGNPVEQSSLELALTNLNLADWRAFAPDLALGGRLNIQLGAAAQQAGRRLQFDLQAGLADFSARIASNRIDHADLALTVRADVDDFKAVQLKTLKARLVHDGQPALDLDASGRTDVAAMNLDLQTAIEVRLPRLAALLDRPDLQLASGSLKFNGRVLQEHPPAGQTTNALPDRSVTGTVRVEDLTGHFADFNFDRFAFAADSDISLKNRRAEIRRLAATLEQSGQPGGTLEITGACDLAKPEGRGSLRLQDLNQSVLRSVVAPFFGSNRLDSVSVNLNAQARFDPQSGSNLEADLRVENLVLSDPHGRFPKSPTAVLIALAGTHHENLAVLRQCAGKIAHGGLPAGTFDANGRFDLKTRAAQAKLKVTDLNRNAFQPFLTIALGDLRIASASLNLDAEASYSPPADAAVKGEFQILNLLLEAPRGRLPSAPLSATVGFDGSLHDNLAEIRQLHAAIEQGGLIGGSFDVKGSYHLTDEIGEVQVQLKDLNQVALAPLLAGSLGDQQIETISMNLTGSGRYRAGSESSAKVDLRVSNLVVSDRSSPQPAVPLAFGLQLEGALARQTLDLRQCLLSLGQTPRAQNQIQLDGRVELARPEAIAGQLKLTAESLDLTPAYDLFVGNKTSIGQAQNAQAPPSPTTASAEPQALRLPVGQFDLEAAIGRLYLREIEVTDLAAAIRIVGSKIGISPLTLKVNGAPVSLNASANLGVPGYEYDARLSVDRLPLEPLLDSFEIGSPDQFRGFVVAHAAIKGAGLTPSSLQKNLAGQANLTVTNATLRLTGPEPDGKGSRGLGTALLSGVFKTAGVALQLPDLAGSPVDFLDARAEVNQGTAYLRSLLVQSPLFQATSAGTISLADPLEVSRLNDLPVDIALERNTAIKARMASPTASPESTYVKLPNFVKVRGTLANPEVKTDPAALALRAGAETLKQSIGDLTDGVVPKAPTTPSLPQAPKPSLPTSLFPKTP